MPRAGASVLTAFPDPCPSLRSGRSTVGPKCTGMRSHIALVAFFAVASGALSLTLEGPKWIPAMAEWLRGEDRVLVFLVGGTDGVERVRRSVHPSRITFSSPTALALKEGRIVAVGQEAVGEPLMASGWIDRKIEIFTVDRRDILFIEGHAGGANKDVDPERLARLNELVKKPTLSYGEQLFVMQAMNDGVMF